MSKPIGMRDLAKGLGLSVATVSRALRGDPSVKAETKEAIFASARELGYEFNPYVGQLMSAMRRKQGESMKGNLALIWYDGFPHPLDKPNKDLQRAAMVRADELGYCMDEMDRRQYTGKALVKILGNRGVRGVLISPPSRLGKVHLNLQLDEFACVSMGWSLYSPAFHCVRFDHFQAVRLALHHAKRRFGSAVAALINFRIDRRADHLFRGSFLAHHPGGPVMASSLLFDTIRFNRTKFVNALKAGRIKGLISHDEQNLPHGLLTLIPKENIIYLDDKTQATRYGSVDCRYDLLSRRAVDLLVATLQQNERGVPISPVTVLVPPRVCVTVT